MILSKSKSVGYSVGDNEGYSVDDSERNSASNSEVSNTKMSIPTAIARAFSVEDEYEHSGRFLLWALAQKLLRSCSDCELAVELAAPKQTRFIARVAVMASVGC